MTDSDQAVLERGQQSAAPQARTVNVEIDGRRVEALEGESVLQAAAREGIYIPALCAHPDLPNSACRSSSGCGLCVVEKAGGEGLEKSCDLAVQDNMQITTQSDAIKKQRQENLARVLANHPHVCLTCPQREGCARNECSFGNPVETRCCSLFPVCPLRKVADHVGISNATPAYKYDALPVFNNDPFFNRDYNLCIDCRRCLTACNDYKGVGCLEVKSVETPRGTRNYVAPKADSLIESGCKFCQSCVTVCPTGALTDRTIDPAHRESSMVPCTHACPAGIDVPRYVQLAAKGKYSEAIAVVREKLPFPGILGRACFAMCESACRRKDLDDPLSIRSLKRVADDNDSGLWRQYAKQLPATNKQVAIIGAGPAGLTAAYYLAKQGHSVTVFDGQPAAGGMARYGIPSYRVPGEVIDREVSEVEKVGVQFRFGERINDLTALREQGYEAIFIGIGCMQGDRLGIPGDDLDGVVDSPNYLRQATMGMINQPGGIQTGSKVVVIGGGNVATDNARSSRRYGADVDMVYRRTREEMPAREDEYQGCVDEGVNIRYLLSPNKIEQNPSGDGLLITWDKMQLGAPDASGRRRPETTGEQLTERADLIIAAIGQRPELFAGFGVNTDKNGRIQVDAKSLQTNLSGVYAGGDCVLGPSTLIESVAHGRLAAEAIDRALGGDGDISEKLCPEEPLDPYIGADPSFNQQHRQHPPLLANALRQGWDEVESGFSHDDAMAEASRCLKCNLAANISDAPLPPEGWYLFNEDEINAITEESGVYQLLDEDKSVLSIKGVEILREGLLEKLQSGSTATFFVIEEAALYTSRESQLIQAYMQEHGCMPEGGDDDMDDLF